MFGGPKSFARLRLSVQKIDRNDLLREIASHRRNLFVFGVFGVAVECVAIGKYGNKAGVSFS